MRLYNVHTLEETRNKLQHAFKKNETESVSLDDALDRIISKDIYSAIPVPTFNRSTVDGYAVISNQTDGASDTLPMLFEYGGQVEMGKNATKYVTEENVFYVPTGGMVPEGADAMVMIEYTEKIGENIAIMKQARPYENMIKRGDDVKSGQLILKAGQKLAARHIGVLAATGQFHIEVYKQLSVSIISTGDELITTDQKLLKGEVFDINTHTIKNMSEKLDLIVLKTYVLKDDKDLIKETISKCITNSDIVVISGGSSVGHKDFTADIIDELAEASPGVIVHGLAIKPGKPTIVGIVKDKLVLGLPGHPVSAMMVYDQIIRMYLENMSTYEPNKIEGQLTKNIHAAPGKETFVMVTVENGLVTPVLGKSGMITLMSRADGYVKVKANDEGIEKGNQVTVYLLD